MIINYDSLTPTPLQHPTKDLNLLPVAVKCPVEKQINGGGGGLGPFGTFVVVIFVLMLVGFAAIYVFAHVFENPTYVDTPLRKQNAFGKKT